MLTVSVPSEVTFTDTHPKSADAFSIRAIMLLFSVVKKKISFAVRTVWLCDVFAAVSTNAGEPEIVMLSIEKL